MRAALFAGAFLFATVMGGGCVVLEKRTGYLGSGARACHPSQYWDGQQCRHKGKGHGARKHDGAGKGKKG
jgi:hypothetical protein